MPNELDQKLSDEQLDQLARKLFAEVRGENPEDRAGKVLETAGVVAGEVLPEVPDWLLNADDNAAD